MPHHRPSKWKRIGEMHANRLSKRAPNNSSTMHGVRRPHQAIVLFYFPISVIIIAHIIVKHLAEREKNQRSYSRANFIFSRIIFFSTYSVLIRTQMRTRAAITHVK